MQLSLPVHVELFTQSGEPVNDLAMSAEDFHKLLRALSATIPLWDMKVEVNPRVPDTVDIPSRDKSIEEYMINVEKTKPYQILYNCFFWIMSWLREWRMDRPRCVLETKCLTCGSTDKKPMRCMGCHTSNYCSKECQRKDWPLHKQICPRLVKVAKTISALLKYLPDDVRISRSPADRRALIVKYTEVFRYYLDNGLPDPIPPTFYDGPIDAPIVVDPVIAVQADENKTDVFPSDTEW